MVFVLHIYYIFFDWKNKYSKVVNVDVHGASMGPSSGTPKGPMIESSGDVRGTSVMYVFKIQVRNILNLLWQVTQDFTVNCGSETFSEQYFNLNNEN